MVTIDDRAFCEGLDAATDRRTRQLLERLLAKWPLWVLQVLNGAGGPLRFTRVLEQIDGISQKVLTQNLRALERDGLVTRTLYPEVPPRVEYAITPLGTELLIQILPLWRWMVAHLDVFEGPTA